MHYGNFSIYAVGADVSKKVAVIGYTMSHKIITLYKQHCVKTAFLLLENVALTVRKQQFTLFIPFVLYRYNE